VRSVKRTLVVLLSLALVLSLFAGCGTKPADTTEPTEDTTPAAPEEPKLKVGLVFDVGGRGDLSFNDMAYAGLEQAATEFGDKIETRFLEPTAGGENREELVRLLAQEGFDLIFGVGFLFTDHMIKVSQEFPDSKFALIDGYIDALTADSNTVCLLFQEHEGSFLVGAAAGLKTETDKVGFVGGMKIPLIERFEAGYKAGVKYVNPDAEVFVDYIGTTGEAFKDPVRGKELSLAQYGKGADIIYHASGASGIGVIEAAVEAEELCIGVDADQSLTAKEGQRAHILTSMLKRVDVAVYDTIKALVEDSFEGGYGVFGLMDDGVGYAVNEYNEDMIAAIKPQLEDLKQQVINGGIVVPMDNAQYEEYLANLNK